MWSFKNALGLNTTVSPTNPLPVTVTSGGGGGGGASSTVTQPDGTGITEIGTTLSKFADGFNNSGDTAPDPARWTVVRQNLVTAAIANGALTLTVPATAGAEYLMVGKINSTIPANLMAIVAASARNANTAVRIGYVACDPTTGVPTAHASLSGDFANRANFSYADGNANNGKVETISGNSAVKQVAAVGNTGTGGTGQELTLELRAEDITAAQAFPDAIGARSGGWRISSQVPNPGAVYRPFIWILNTAAATACTWTFQRFLSMDIQELQAEVGGGRGNSSASQAIPVNIVQSITQAISGTVNAALNAGANVIGNIQRLVAWNESTAVIAASGTFTGVSRDTGVASGGNSPWANFKALVRLDQAATANLQGSNDGTNWATIITQPVVANTAITLATPVFFRYHRIVVVNGTTATTSTFINSAYSL